MKNLIIAVVLFCTAVCIAGCSRNVGLSGKVTFPDGTPLTVGDVYFETDTFLAHGTIGKEGAFGVLGRCSPHSR
ncbi:MAG: hypothetical protein LBG58_09865 [Planctomycetaceae bacterium]|jgi:hypothetical protein|nr:hypothetical protein [Planctomycetaceae bacterium]